MSTADDLVRFLKDCFDDEDALCASMQRAGHGGVARAQAETESKRAIVAYLREEADPAVAETVLRLMVQPYCNWIGFDPSWVEG